MTEFIGKGDVVPGLGLCIGWYSCTSCKRDHQVFGQESKGVCQCGGLWRSVSPESIHDESVGTPE